MRTALIFGANGQDGSYLSEFLLSIGYTVYGVIKRSSTFNIQNLSGCINNSNFHLIHGDITDYSSVDRIIRESYPDEIYNLAAMSHVGVSFNEPIHTMNVVGLGVVNILESCRQMDYEGKIYQASSSEMWGNTEYGQIQNEETPFNPRSPYACAKVYAHQMCLSYRNYGLKTYMGILTNHESERRSENFVTRKITKYVGKISFLSNLYSNKQILEQCGKLKLGNIDSVRDWGYSPEYVRGMYKLLRLKQPTELVLSTGICHSVKDFMEFCFSYAGFRWEDFVEIDQSLFRPNDVTYLCGDSSKAKKMINWEPKYSMEDIAVDMLANDFDIAASQKIKFNDVIL